MINKANFNAPELGHTAFGLSVCVYIHPSEDQFKIFGQGKISRPINGSKLIFHMRIYLYEPSRNIQEPWPHDLYFMVQWLRTLARLSRLRFLSKVEAQVDISYEDVSQWDQQEYTRAMTFWPTFHGLLTSDFGQIIKVKIFVQGRSSRPINGSKLIFHMRMYPNETSRNIHEPWPPDLYFTVYWLRTLARLFLSKVESQDLLMVASWYFIWDCISMRPAEYTRAMTSWPIFHSPLTSDFGQIIKVKIFVQGRSSSWYFIWGCISMRPAGIYKSHDLLTYISRSTDFGLWPDYQG